MNRQQRRTAGIKGKDPVRMMKQSDIDLIRQTDAARTDGGVQEDERMAQHFDGDKHRRERAEDGCV
jgi:hypothetical protein